MVKFLSDSVNTIILPSALLSIYDTLFNVVVTENQDDGMNNCNSRKDAYILLIMKALPFAARELDATEPARLDHLMERMKAYVLKKRDTSYVSVLQVHKEEDDGENNNLNALYNNDYIHVLMNQLFDFQKNEFQEGSLMRPYLVFPSQINQGMKHSLEPVEIPVYNAQVGM